MHMIFLILKHLTDNNLLHAFQIGAKARKPTPVRCSQSRQSNGNHIGKALHALFHILLPKDGAELTVCESGHDFDNGFLVIQEVKAGINSCLTLCTVELGQKRL